MPVSINGNLEFFELKRNFLDRKGNSLFAEVDDQRKKMKTMLQGERAHYLDMKKSFNAKEMEIRRLKRENASIKQEIQACANILMRGEQIALKTQRDHTTLLMAENAKLRDELLKSEEKLIDLAKDQNLSWVESILSTANNETRSLKDKLFANMLVHSQLSDALKKNADELGKARLDCVKLKTLLRQIVSSHGIKINDEDVKDIKLDREVLDNLKIEEYETLEEDPLDSPATSNSEELSESMITLLGGRQRLGNAIPHLSPGKIEVEVEKTSEESSKENCGENLEKSSSSYKIESPKKAHSPLKDLPPIPNAVEPKSVKFSENVSTKVIDSTSEGYEQSKLARKRQVVTVKRIVIPTKTAAKKD